MFSFFVLSFLFAIALLVIEGLHLILSISPSAATVWFAVGLGIVSFICAGLSDDEQDTESQ